MTLNAWLRHRRGGFALDVSLDLAAGQVLAVLGPNGSGKSTLLGCLAGMYTPEHGEITLADRVLTGPGRNIAPHDRGIGLLAQDALLFPHMSTVDNVAFGPRSRGAGRRDAREIALRWLAEVDAVALAERKPGQLSGGQAQRVAIARALAGEPRLLLLDEPLAALDVDVAPAIRGLLRTVLRERGDRATILVTHDPLDALALADQVLVLDAGHVVERGPTRQVLAAPRTAFTARIAGLNLVAGTADTDGLHLPGGELLAGLPAEDAVVGEPAVAVFSPGSVAVYPRGEGHGGSPRNAGDAVVAALEPHGAVIRVRTTGPGWTDGVSADLTTAAIADLGLVPGDRVELSVKAAAVAIHPALGDRREHSASGRRTS